MDTDNKPSCFVIMPISDTSPYESGHFERVYRHLIVPACQKSGFDPIRADEVKATNYIVVDILHRVATADMVLCDLSGTNPNVLYELGVRQAFNRPVTLVKDSVTERIFDIQGFRYIEYDHQLRIDVVKKNIREISEAITETLSAGAEGVNSLIPLLNVEPADLSSPFKLDPQATLILDAVRDLGGRVGQLEGRLRSELWEDQAAPSRKFRRGDRVVHQALGRGRVLQLEGKGEDLRLIVYFDKKGRKKLLAKYAQLTRLKPAPEPVESVDEIPIDTEMTLDADIPLEAETPADTERAGDDDIPF